MDRFKALVIERDEATKVQTVSVKSLATDELMPGNVTIRVTCSTMNYKDGLAITGTLPVVRRFPMVPGIDLAGTVTESASPDFKPGDQVIVNGWGLGEVHYGAFAELARVEAGWPILLPPGMSPADAMAIGTAGYTAMLCVMALEHQGIAPDRGAVVVTGATGGVGSVAIALLSKLGYTVEAVTGRASEADYLQRLGAKAIIERAELEGTPKPLAKERWAGGIDAVGGVILANMLSMISRRGAVAACGNTAGTDLPTSVHPFILRGVALLGIDSVVAPKEQRLEAWRRLATDLDRTKLAAMTKTIGFDDIERAARDIVAGKVRGRRVVQIA